MKKILLSLGTIVVAIALVTGATGAFLGDRETSTGNTFASGVIDLKIDNESYVTNDLGKLVASSGTSWSLSGLAGKLFFNFPDIKPGDIGEDTISLHVNNNNAWACMSVTMTGTPENGVNDPEALVDTTVGTQQGELQNALFFSFWADDGDNVYETGEQIFKEGLVKDLFNGETWRLADSTGNIWSGDKSPIAGGSTKYIGKAWCYGDLQKTPKSQDGSGKTGSNGPLVRGTGFTCNGAPLGNIYQSDGVTADVTFEATQSRSNSAFTCAGGGDPTPERFTLFFDNFESCKLKTDFNSSWQGKWDQQGGAQAEYANSARGNTASLDAGNNSSGPDHQESITSKSIDMTIYHDITLSYDRNMDVPSGTTATLTVQYSINDGTTWTTLETVTVDHDWITKTWSLSPAADHKSAVKIRFTLTGTNSSNHAYIDNVTVTGLTP